MAARPRSTGSHLPGHLIAFLLALCAGCASTTETPLQTYVWEMGRTCDALSDTWHMDTVDADGRYTIRRAANAVAGPKLPYIECMKEQFETHPFPGWAKARADDAQWLAARGDQMAAARSSAQSAAVTVPRWQVGDEWQYAYSSPSGSGTYVWAVDRVDVLDGVEHYVIKSGPREIFYRVSDLASSLEKINGAVVARETPPRRQYDWPLTVGKSWEQSFQTERPAPRQPATNTFVWTVESEETVTVPAGTFRTLKIVWRTKSSNTLIHEVWYAPEAKQWVKIREVLSTGIRERELTAVKLK